jgi:hypothetical protein
MRHPRGRRGRRAAGALAAGAAALALGCTQTTVLRTRYSLASEPAIGEDRTQVTDARRMAPPAPGANLDSVLRMDHDGLTVPVISPDGRRAVVQTQTNAPWNVRLGDAPPAAGLASRLEGVSLEPASLGLPIVTLAGPWLIGRAATDEAFLAERPRRDGGRDIALVAWDGGAVHEVAVDGWTNAFATITPGGALAWARRPAEGGDWSLVMERGGVRRTFRGAAGDQWVFPVFAGDGSGLFAFRISGVALSVAWVPFETDGFPSEDALEAPAAAMPLGLDGSLLTVARIMQPVDGLAASRPGSDRIVLYLPSMGRAVSWTPGGTLEPLADRSVAALLLDADAALVTTPEMLGLERLSDPEGRLAMLAEGPWLARPLARSGTPDIPGTVVAVIRMRAGRVELAQLDAAQPRASR